MGGVGKIGIFDSVKLLSTKRVLYLSAPPGVELSPLGVWTVSALLPDLNLLLTKSSMVIKIPVSDVLKVADYDLDGMTTIFGKLSQGKLRNGQRQIGQSQDTREP